MKMWRNTIPGLDFSHLATWEKIPALSSSIDYVRPMWRNTGREHDLKSIRETLHIKVAVSLATVGTPCFLLSVSPKVP